MGKCCSVQETKRRENVVHQMGKSKRWILSPSRKWLLVSKMKQTFGTRTHAQTETNDSAGIELSKKQELRSSDDFENSSSVNIDRSPSYGRTAEFEPN